MNELLMLAKNAVLYHMIINELLLNNKNRLKNRLIIIIIGMKFGFCREKNYICSPKEDENKVTSCENI